MRYDLVVGGIDKGYLRAFVEFLLASDLNQFNIHTVTTQEELSVLFDEPVYGMFALEEALFQQVAGDSNLPTEKITVLTEPLTSVDAKAVFTVLKYQKASLIEEILIKRCQETETREIIAGSGVRTKTITFYSPSGGLGTTTFAQLFATYKSSKGYKVLFLGLDTFQGYDLCFNSLQTYNMSDYMVQILSADNWMMVLEQMVSIDDPTGIHYLKPVNHEMDLDDYGPDRWPEWIAYVSNTSDYDYIVVDPGQRNVKDICQLLDVSDHKVYLFSPDYMGKYKWQKFIKQFTDFPGENIGNNQTLFCRASKEQSTEIAYDGLIHDDPEVMKNDRDGRIRLNTQSQTYRQVEVFLEHV